MTKNLQSKQIKSQRVFIIITGLWVAYTILYVYLKQYGITKAHAGYLALIAQVSLDIFASVLAFHLWKKITDKKKIIFALLVL